MKRQIIWKRRQGKTAFLGFNRQMVKWWHLQNHWLTPRSGSEYVFLLFADQRREGVRWTRWITIKVLFHYYFWVFSSQTHQSSRLEGALGHLLCSSHCIWTHLFLVSAFLLNTIVLFLSSSLGPSTVYLLKASCGLDPKLGSGDKEERHWPWLQRAHK